MPDDWKETARLYNVYYRARADGEGAGYLGQVIAANVDEAERTAKTMFKRSLEVIRVEFVKKLYSEDGNTWA